ncbi:sulfurtransferase [Streptomyces sp. NPDC092903]|uniref:sulfurtransferase n=1 Tax=Streptomyces sp. NPDC092903 TaxID=3366017 RepID=UPI003817A28A
MDDAAPACDDGPPGPLVGPDWLAARLGRPGLRVFDSSVGAHREAPVRIPGARPFDLDGALSEPGAPLPHTMPDADRFTEEMRALGLHDGDAVVVYDAVGLYSAARAWWMLRAMGLDRVAVLDGGLPGWTAAGLPTREGASDGLPARGDFTAVPRPGMFVDADEVAAALTDPAAVVFDARSRERFGGTAPEPRPGLRGGHMPGAVNLPFTEVQHEGRMRPAAELRALFGALAPGRSRLLFSCGSGVTACVPALAAALAGRGESAVYDGSWSEWGLPSENRPVVTGG